MIPPLKPGAACAIDGPVIETARLILRPWRSRDIAANTAMLSDPATARFIAADGKPVTTELGRLAQRRRDVRTLGAAWLRHVRRRREGERQTMSAAWARGRRRQWPGFEVGWGIAKGIPRQGLCGGSGAGIDRLGVCDLRDRRNHPLHRCRERAVTSRRPAARGEEGSRRSICSARLPISG